MHHRICNAISWHNLKEFVINMILIMLILKMYLFHGLFLGMKHWYLVTLNMLYFIAKSYISLKVRRNFRSL